MNSCVLCKTLPCCPEHCCNWDDCTCGDCEACMEKPKIEPQQVRHISDEPVKIILLNSKTGKAETEIKTARVSKDESKEEELSPKAAGGGVFGIRYLKKSKK